MKKRSRKSVSRRMKPMNMKKMWYQYGTVKLASMAFILFLITVWPAAMALVHSIHWGWFLAAAILFSLLHWKNCKHMHK